jgi:LPPG:FO 2-phospho-L-lactate transferase
MKKFLAISGGVGGAKLGLGLTQILSEDQLSFLVNTGDDFKHAGVNISPDMDTLMYTLSGLSNQQLGWGRADESWAFLDSFKTLGGESWFQLGDRDLAVHLRRTELLDSGLLLSEVTTEFFNRLGVKYRCWPMSETKVATKVYTDDGLLSFQHYFVRDHCEHKVKSIIFEGNEEAQPPQGLIEYFDDPDLAGVIICPSNPYLSIDPILSVEGIHRALTSCEAPVIAISPIINGESVKGPTSKIMAELSLELSAKTVALHYEGIINGFVLDTLDQQLVGEIEDTGCAVLVTNTMMNTLDDKTVLAQTVLELCDKLGDLKCG